MDGNGTVHQPTIMSHISGTYFDAAVTPMFKVTDSGKDPVSGAASPYLAQTICMDKYPDKCIVHLTGPCNGHGNPSAVALINCAGKGMTPFYKFDGIDGSRFTVPIIALSQTGSHRHINKNCHKIRGPNDEEPLPELLWKSSSTNYIRHPTHGAYLPAGEGGGGSCGAMVLCGGKTGGEGLCQGLFANAWNNEAPNQICEQPYVPPDPDKIYPNTTRR